MPGARDSATTPLTRKPRASTSRRNVVRLALVFARRSAIRVLNLATSSSVLTIVFLLARAPRSGTDEHGLISIVMELPAVNPPAGVMLRAAGLACVRGERQL